MTKTQSEALAAVIAKAVTTAVVEALSSGEAGVEATTTATVRQQPTSNAKTRRSAKPVAKVSAVRRLAGVEESGTSLTAAQLRKGHVFVLRSNGAMYTVKSVLRTGSKVTVATDHPKVEQMTLNGEAVVTLCYYV